MPRGRATTYPEQRDGILQHAATLFAQRGFSATSMHELARAAGVSKALLYHYFEDKKQLLLAIAEGHIDRLTALADEVEAQCLPPEERLTRLVERFVEEYAHARAHHQVLVQDLKYLDGEDQQRVRGKERRVVAAFSTAIVGTEPMIGTTRLETPLSMLLFGMINWLFTWFRDEGPLDYAALARLVSAFVRGGLQRVATDEAIDSIRHEK